MYIEKLLLNGYTIPKYEPCGELADRDGDPFKADHTKSTETDHMPVMGTCGNSADLSGFD